MRQPGLRDDAPLGILAGGTGVPCEIAAAVTARGRSVHIVGLKGEAEPEIALYSHTWVNWGGIGAMLEAFKRHHCQEIVIVGRVRRPNLTKIRPDLGFWANLPGLLPFLRGGDDTILRRVVGFFERHGLNVIGAHEAAPELIAPAGVLGQHGPGLQHRAAIECGIAALVALGPFDAAQAAVARDGQLIAVEGADGTDAMLRRLKGSARSGVLVKMPKPDQERRIDLPAIGPETVRRGTEIGLSGIAVLSGQTLFAERARALELADASRQFIVGLTPHAAAPRAGADEGGGIEGLKALARREPSANHTSDCVLGARVLNALEPFWAQASVVVSRGYVLATEGPGGAAAAAQRAGRLKPWGMRLLRRSSGALVVSDLAGEIGFDPGEIIRRCRASGLAGVAILRTPRDETALAILRTEADRAGLFVMAPGDAR